MKSWIRFITRHHLAFLMLGAVAGLVSIFLIKDLNVEAFPDPSPPMIDVITIYEGRSVEEVEKRITIPIEVALASMRGLERINSVSLYGLSDIKCRFSYDIEYLSARQEVINRIVSITLPDGIQPSINPTGMGEVMRYVLSGSNNLMELRTLQDWVAGRYIKTAPGVEDVGSWGGFIKAYVVKVLPEDLIKYDLRLSQVIDTLAKSNVNVGGRVVELGSQYYMVRGLGLIKSLADIENNVVSYKNGKPVLIKNIAQVTLGNIPRTGIAIYNNNDDAVMGIVFLRRGEKSIPSIRAIHSRINDLNERILPKGIKVVPYYERWGLILTVIYRVIENTVVGILLVGLALFIFLGSWRAAMLTAVEVPLSLAITLGLMSLQGDSANILSIGAIDLGIIADIGLVLSENYVRIARKRSGGLSEATSDSVQMESAGQVGTPIILLVLIIILAFIPIFTMKGAEKQIFGPMAKTYSYALVLALILSFTFLSAAIHAFLRGHEGQEFHFFEHMREGYARLIATLFRRPRLVLAATAIIILIGFGYSIKVIGTQFLPKLDEGNIYLRVTFPYSIALGETHARAKQIRDILVALPEAKSVAVQVGRPEDGTDPTGPFNTEYYVGLKPYSEWTRKITKEDLQKEVRQKVANLFPNVTISLSQYIQDNLEEVMTGVKGENAVKIFGEDLHELDRLAKDVRESIERIPEIKDVGIYKELGQPNLLIEVDRGEAAALGITVWEILDMISAALGGRAATQVIEGDRFYALNVRFPYDYRRAPEKIPTIPIILPTGGIVPLSRVAKIRYDTGASFIYRENFKRYIPVKFSVDSSNLGGTVEKAQKETAKLRIPEGYFMNWSGLFEEMIEAFRRFYISIPFAVFLIAMLLYVFYGNMRNAVLTMVAPVCTVFGGLMSLLLTAQPLSISAVVGFVSIVGISTFHTCILITHYIEMLHEKGGDIVEATYETIRDKFRPVLMVGLVASLGLLPASMARGVGSQVQKPLAIVVVGGMLIGTLIILLVMPLLFRFVRVDKLGEP